LEQGLKKYCNDDKKLMEIYFVYNYGDGNGNILHMSEDGKYFNHDSENSNVRKLYSKDYEKGKEPWIAIRDIKENEELLINYRVDDITNEPEWYAEIAKKHGIDIAIDYENDKDDKDEKENQE